MARSMWKGAISFGLVHIPVEMYPAVSDQGLDLTMLDRRDFSPIGFKRYNKGNNKEVTWDDIVKGYEYSAGEYVVLSDEDLRRANPEATSTIDILAFVGAEEVPLLYYDHPYYLAPGKGGDKVYALLRETLRKTGKIGIANVVIRVKQHLAALVCVGDVIVLNTLRYLDEIRASEDLKIPTASSKTAAISDKEIKMAMALVEGMSDKWEPENYHDTYREDVLALIEKKVAAKETKTITMPEKGDKQPASTNVIDLVALLQASIGKKPATRTGAADDDDEDPPPRKARKPNADETPEEAAPAPRARKSASTDTEKIAASASRPKRAPAKTAPAKAAPVAKAPARRKKAA